IRNFSWLGLLPHAQAARLGIDLGRIGEDLAAHPPVNDFLVLDVVVGKDAEDDKAHDQECCQAGSDKRAGKLVAKALRAGNFDLNGQTSKAESPSFSQTHGGPERYLLVR